MAREIPEKIKYVVGDNLTRARQYKGWTQAQAAKRLGMSVRHLQRLEGGWNMTILTAANLARKYGESTWRLFVPTRWKLDRQPGRPRKRVVVRGRSPFEDGGDGER
ncbi:MAG: helix-turn-helix transcriptional regulator [Polyangiaceae bacterium]